MLQERGLQRREPAGIAPAVQRWSQLFGAGALIWAGLTLAGAGRHFILQGDFGQLTLFGLLDETDAPPAWVGSLAWALSGLVCLMVAGIAWRGSRPS